MSADVAVNGVALYALTFIGGVLTTILTTAFLNRRALFTYQVTHARIGLTGEDPVYGSVQVLWNEKPVKNQLYLSTIELTNTSTRDFDDVVATIYTNTTELLTEKSELSGTTQIIDYSDNYKEQLEVAEGEDPSDSQFRLHTGRREYHIPTMLRGQVAKFEYLNAANSGQSPVIHAEVIRSGVKLKERGDEPKVFGESQNRAAIAGLIVCSIAVAAILHFFGATYATAIGAFVLGLFGNVPGAYSLKLWRWIQRGWAG